MAWRPDYTTLAEIKDDVLKIADTADDDLLSRHITTSSRAIDRATNRQFGKTDATEERFYRVEWRPDRGRWVAVIDDLMTTTGLVLENEDGDVVTDYRLEPLNAAADGRPWERLVIGRDSSVSPVGPDYLLAITATWGWTAVPAAIKAATELQTSRLFARRESPYGVAGSPDMGSEIRLLAKVDADVQVAVADYVRIRRLA